MRRIIATCLFVALTACGDDGGSGSHADARPVGMDAPVECKAEAAYGTPTLADVFAERDLDTNPENLLYNGSMNTDYDDLTIELYKGYGVFTDTEIIATTVQLTGDEADYYTCGACVLIYANWNRETAEEEMLYLAIGGTLNITQVSPNIQGTLINASFVHVTVDEEGASTPAPDACASSIASVSFDSVVETTPPKAVAPGPSRRARHRHR